MRIALSATLIVTSFCLLAACAPKAKAPAPSPKMDINLIGNLDVDPNYGSALNGAGRFDASKAYTNSVGMQLVPVRAGQFVMGSPVTENGRQNDETSHEVSIAKPFHVGIHEVTQRQWEAVMQSRPWYGQDHVSIGDNHPATHVKWEDANLFCQVLSRREGRTYRLPTEAEWEYVCRAGTSTPFHFDAGRLHGVAWFDSSVSSERSSEVGKKNANAWGLYDMHGNVAEWCSDWYANYKTSDKVSPQGPASGEYRVTRGGSWESMERFCRSAYRAGLSPDAKMATVGFRIVLEHE